MTVICSLGLMVSTVIPNPPPHEDGTGSPRPHNERKSLPGRNGEKTTRSIGILAGMCGSARTDHRKYTLLHSLLYRIRTSPLTGDLALRTSTKV